MFFSRQRLKTVHKWLKFDIRIWKLIIQHIFLCDLPVDCEFQMFYVSFDSFYFREETNTVQIAKMACAVYRYGGRVKITVRKWFVRFRRGNWVWKTEKVLVGLLYLIITKSKRCSISYDMEHWRNMFGCLTEKNNGPHFYLQFSVQTPQIHLFFKRIITADEHEIVYNNVERRRPC